MDLNMDNAVKSQVSRKSRFFSILLMYLCSVLPLSLTVGSESDAVSLKERHYSPVQRLECRNCHKTAAINTPVSNVNQIAEVCYSCHKRPEEVKPSFIISAGLPLSDAKRKTCDTCHYSKPISQNGSRYEDSRYLRREGPTKQFCADCHKKPPSSKSSQPQSD